jgi:hypothetical protein
MAIFRSSLAPNYGSDVKHGHGSARGRFGRSPTAQGHLAALAILFIYCPSWQWCIRRKDVPSVPRTNRH